MSEIRCGLRRSDRQSVIPSARTAMSTATRLPPMTIKPLEWADESTSDGNRLFSAETDFGRYVYGTDLDGKPYCQSPDGETDHESEAGAREAVEAAYRKHVLDLVAPFTVVAEEDVAVSKAREASLDLAAKLSLYANECADARTWGGPTILPRNPIDEAAARRFGAALSTYLASHV